MLRTKQSSNFQRERGYKHTIFSLRIGQDKTGKSVLTSPQYQYRLLHHNHCFTIFISATSSVSESSIFAFVFVRYGYLLISIYKMNDNADIVNFRGRLLERGAYLENLTFWKGAC